MSTEEVSEVLGTTITIEDIRRKITELASTEFGDPLKGAMYDLKLALRHNPEASNLLLPEEIGEMVKYLRKITATEVVAATAADKTKAVKKAIKNANLSDPEFLQQALQDF